MTNISGEYVKKPIITEYMYRKYKVCLIIFVFTAFSILSYWFYYTLKAFGFEIKRWEISLSFLFLIFTPRSVKQQFKPDPFFKWPQYCMWVVSFYKGLLVIDSLYKDLIHINFYFRFEPWMSPLKNASVVKKDHPSLKHLIIHLSRFFCILINIADIFCILNLANTQFSEGDHRKEWIL